MPSKQTSYTPYQILIGIGVVALLVTVLILLVGQMDGSLLT